MRYSSKLINPRRASWEIRIYSLYVRRLDLQLAPEVEDSLVGLSPELVEPDAISRWIVSEFCWTVGHPAWCAWWIAQYAGNTSSPSTGIEFKKLNIIYLKTSTEQTNAADDSTILKKPSLYMDSHHIVGWGWEWVKAEWQRQVLWCNWLK